MLKISKLASFQNSNRFFNLVDGMLGQRRTGNMATFMISVQLPKETKNNFTMLFLLLNNFSYEKFLDGNNILRN